MASDGKWYPPELWTGPPDPEAARVASPTRATDVSRTGPRTRRKAPCTAATVPPGLCRYGAGIPRAPVRCPTRPYGQVQQKTNGLAIAALICGCAGFLLFVPGILGIIFGFIARSQIKRSNGQQKGDGMALAGIIVGFAWVALLVLSIAVNARAQQQQRWCGQLCHPHGHTARPRPF